MKIIEQPEYIRVTIHRLYKNIKPYFMSNKISKKNITSKRNEYTPHKTVIKIKEYKKTV